jgi:SLIT-ROBO Rho GTPase activating protein
LVWNAAIKWSSFSGEDPLADVLDGKDINSIAGVLKLYFRELREPLFPTALFDALIACSSKSYSPLLSGTF